MKHTIITITTALLLAATAFADPIHDAANAGDLAAVQVQLGAGVDVNAKDNNGKTPLHHAVYWGHIEIAELLIDSGVDVNAKDENGRTYLHWAAMGRGHKEIVELLIAKGADVNAKNNSGFIPFQTAVRYGRVEITKMLMDSVFERLTELETKLAAEKAAKEISQTELDAANVAKAELQAQLVASGGSDYDTQVLHLKAGWNLVSFHVKTDDMSPQVLLASISDQLLIIKNLSKLYDTANLGGFESLNTLTKLRLGEGYWIKVTEDLTLTIQN